MKAYTPAWGQVERRAALGPGHADVIKNSMKPADAVDKAFKRGNEIFAKDRRYSLARRT